MPMDQMNWSSLTVRSYPSQKDMRTALSKIITEQALQTVQVQNLPRVDWGREVDFDLIAEKETQHSTSYRATATVPFKVTLHSTRTKNRRGNELENALEFIPAIQTLNFTLVRQ